VVPRKLFMMKSQITAQYIALVRQGGDRSVTVIQGANSPRNWRANSAPKSYLNNACLNMER